MDYGIEIFRQLEMRIFFVRIVVHGIWYWTDIHVPVLALASEWNTANERMRFYVIIVTIVMLSHLCLGLRWISDPFRRGFCHQSHF